MFSGKFAVLGAALAAVSHGNLVEGSNVMEEFEVMTYYLDLWNCTWETHEMVVDDYHLNTFRITGFTDLGPIEVTKPPVLFMHPMGTSADFWILPSSRLPLALNLASRGFDVWLGSVRGDRYA